MVIFKPVLVYFKSAESKYILVFQIPVILDQLVHVHVQVYVNHKYVYNVHIKASLSFDLELEIPFKI